MTTSTRTGFVSDPRFLEHDTGPAAGYLPAGGWLEAGMPGDSPERIRRIENLLDASGLLEALVRVRPRAATRSEVLRAHDAEYVDGVRAASDAGGGDAGEGTPFGAGSYEVALLAAGGCIEAVAAVLDRRVRNAYALVRPAGHHAERARGRGGCLFANTTIAAMYALDHYGLERIAMIDWDVHHGNGAQRAFWEDPRVFTISIHQQRNFPPDTGETFEIGAEAGTGFNLNIPLPPGSGTGAYAAAFERVIVPAVLDYRPELVLLGSGLDASALDPFGRMMLDSDAYRDLARAVITVCDEICEGRLVACHEGGYATEYVPFCALRVIEQLAGIETPVVDPFLEDLKALGGQELQPHQADAIERAGRRL